MKNDKRLGKGLADLLQSNLPDQIDFIQKDQNRVKTYINIKEIKPNPYQPRIEFDKEKLNELASSIKERGIITPILLRKVNDHYEIVAGERRFRAAQICKLEEVPAIVEKFNDQDMAEIALIENIQREDLNAMEEALAYSNLMKTSNLTQEELAFKIGKTRPYIANTLRLLVLPKEVQEMISNNSLAPAAARTLIGLPNDQIIAMAKEITKNKISVREVEKKVNVIKKRKVEVYLKETELLANYLDTKVKIDEKSIKINFKDEQELKNILDKIIKD